MIDMRFVNTKNFGYVSKLTLSDQSFRVENQIVNNE